MPTSAPSAARASARLALTVDLPTPPLPDATAITLRTPSRGFRPPCTACCGICQSISTVTLLTSPLACSLSVTRRASSRRQPRSEEHTSELQSRGHLVCRLLLEKKQ